MKSRKPSIVRSRLILISLFAAAVVIGALWVFGPGRVQPIAPQATLAPAPQATFMPPPDLKELAQQFPRLEKILTNPELDSVYKDFLVAYERGGAEAAELLARQRSLLTPDNHIRVTLVLDTTDSTVLVAELQDLGVIVRGTYKDLIDIGIPLELIVQTAESDNPGQVFDRITQLKHVIALQLPTPGKPNAASWRALPSEAISRPIDELRVRSEIALAHAKRSTAWRKDAIPLTPCPPQRVGGALCRMLMGMTDRLTWLRLSAREQIRGRLLWHTAQPQPPAPIVSEGVETIGADKWQAAGYTGQGIKIGVLDQGFDGYRDLLGRELPVTITAQSFVPGITPDATGITHGVAVAEVIHDVAPDAELYFAYYDGGDVSMGNAVEWLIQQGVHIISHSAGGLAAPLDGTGRDAELVKLAADNGVLWVNSAGNNGLQHYRGAYTDTNNDHVHEFAPDKTLLAFQADPDGPSQIILTWNDWQSGGTQDLDLYLLDPEGDIIASARNSRDGDRPPVEQIVYQFDDARTYYLNITAINSTQPITLNLFVHQTPQLELSDPRSSLATPGDARDALTVGAVHWRNLQVEPFSSRGPTADDRLKPDLAGPDGVSNATYAPQSFFGTSSAAPHIAGAAALVWSAYPPATAAEIRNFLVANAVDLGPAGPDDDTGAGLLLLSDPPPPATPVSPSPTTARGEPTLTPPPTATLRPIVLATLQRPLPGAAATVNAPTAGLGLIAMGLAIAIGTGVGFYALYRIRSASRPDRLPNPPSPDRISCVYCGYQITSGAHFCAQCGRPTQDVAACPHCQAPLRPGAVFCGRCGAAC